MPKLNQKQKLLLFFITGLAFGYVLPIAGILIAAAMVVLGWKEVFSSQR